MYIRLLVNMLCEFVPIALFVIQSELSGFVSAVCTLIITTVIATIVSWVTERHIPKFGIVAAGTIVFFGVLTIIFQNPFFIIIKDTLYYLGFAVAILIGLYFKKSVLKSFFGDFFTITATGWRILEIRWAGFFFLLAIGNEVARTSLLPEAWAVYKLIIVCVTWVFGFYQLKVTKKYRLPDATPLGLRIR